MTAVPMTETLAGFVAGVRYEDLPPGAVHVAKRVLLDSIGCGIAGVDTDKGRACLEVARCLGGPAEATVLGTGLRVGVATAAFANGETINAQDYDAILRPAVHATPWVLPAAMAAGERTSGSGRELLVGVVVAHELSNRLARAMPTGNRRADPTVSGYSFNTLSAAAVAARMLGLDAGRIAQAIAIASYNAPVSSYAAWEQSGTSALIKYGSAGWAAQTGVTSALLARAGYDGERSALDGEHGYWRRAGAIGWEPAALLDGPGERWAIEDVRFKRYPCCGITHSALDAFTSLVADYALGPGDIDAVRIWLDPTVELPLWQDRIVEDEVQAQFSVAYNIAVAAHPAIAYRAWLEDRTRRDPGVRAFMDRIEVHGLAEFDDAAAQDPAVQLARVEIEARGKRLVRENRYPSGRASPDHEAPGDAEIERKFSDNVAGRLPDDQAERLAATVWALERLDDAAVLLALARHPGSGPSTR